MAYQSRYRSFSALTIVLVVAVTAAAVAQDRQGDQNGNPTREFHWTGKLSPDQIVEIKNLNGKIEARADSSIDQVEVTAEKSGRDADEVKIDVVPSGDGVTICAIYPHGATGPCEPGDKWHVDSHNEKAKVDFTIRIPTNLRFAANTVNGSVTAENIGRVVRANSVNGSLHVSTKQWAELSSVNGSIEASMGSADWTGTLKIGTVNGSIDLRMPSELNADVRFSSVNGRLTSDFPLTMSGKFGGRRIEGRIGNGGRELVVDTVNGSLRLKSESI